MDYDTRMGEIIFHNTMGGRKEPFVPLQAGEVRMYTCGPTVYNFAHIGNFRTFVFQDILRRFLLSRGLHVIQVMNFTDVDDRIIANAAAEGVDIRTYTEKYIEAFLADRRALSLEMPEYMVRATEHIDDLVKLIERLTAKGFTYVSEGSTYFRISKFPNYGKLTKLDVTGIQAGARVDVDQYDKADARDFALWKAPKPGEFFWETRIGPGRPGWHIECSAMAMKYLGETIDIHSGGVDLAFPHHENEIAQSEAATGKRFVDYWLHAEHLLVNFEKMSKSLGNFFTLRDLLAKGNKPSALRFLLASVPYRRQLNFTQEGLQQASSSVERLRNFAGRLRSGKFPAGISPVSEDAIKAERDFEHGLEDDLNTPRAITELQRLVYGGAGAETPGLQAELLAGGRMLGLLGQRPQDWFHRGADQSRIDERIAARIEARKQRRFADADRIRAELAGEGIVLEDKPDGTTEWRRA